MRKISSTTLITLFLFLCIAGIQAQTDNQADKLMNAIKEGNNTNALILAKNIDVKDVNSIIRAQLACSFLYQYIMTYLCKNYFRAICLHQSIRPITPA